MTTKEKILALCEKKKTNLYNVEKAAGVGNGVIARWDQSSPNMATLLKVAKALDVPVTELIADEAVGE